MILARSAELRGEVRDAGNQPVAIRRERPTAYLSFAFTAFVAGISAAEPVPAPLVAAPPPSSRPVAPTAAPPSLTGAPSSQANSVLPSADSVAFPADPAVPLLENPLRWGPFQLRPHLDYRLYYATEVYVQPGEAQDTVRHSIAPGLLIESPHLLIDYTPTFNYYARGRFENGVDHALSFDLHVGTGDWTFALSHDYSKTSEVLIETARQTDTQENSTVLQAGYRLSEKTSFDFYLNQTFLDSSGFNSSREWSTMNWVNYQATETTTIGAGLGGGFADVDQGSDMTYELVQGKVSWQPGNKLSVDLNGGVEIRQFLDVDGASDRVNPIMGAVASYRIFENTSVRFEADHSVNTSLIQDQITEDTTILASLSQRFFGILNATLSGGYRKSDYQPTTTSPIADRTDETSHIGISVGTAFLQRGAISVSYRRMENVSTQEGFGFTSNQYTLNLAYRF